MLTVVADDRVGLVKALADIVTSNGGNWERSHLAELAGTFAGVVVVTVPDYRSGQSQAALAPLEGLLEVSVRSTEPEPSRTQQPRQMKIELLGNDRPGIVSGVLARHGLGVTDLQTATREAPMAGGLLFEASAVVIVDSEASLDRVRTDLEELANEILIDLSFVEIS